jgi:hypothetical protein
VKSARSIQIHLTPSHHSRERTIIMRVLIRWIHIICAIPITGYIYSPFAVLPDYATPTRYVFFPVMVLSGLWMWKGHLVRRLFSTRSVEGITPDRAR